MHAKNLIAAGALLSVVAAVPMAKRDVVWVTKTDEAIVTVPVTTTVWLNPGDSVPTAAPSHFGHHQHSRSHVTVHSTVTVPAPSAPASAPPSASSAPSSVETSAAPTEAAPSSQQAPPPSSATSTSVFVAPTTISMAPVAPTTSSATSAWVAPVSTQAPSSSEAPTTTSGPATSAASGSSPAGATYTGDITHYDVGMGSCGWTNSDSDDIVAIPHGMMNNGANPNDNPLCGQFITISYQGATNQAKIVDTCGGCDDASIDLSPSLFSKVAPNGDGRVHDVTWWFSN